MRTHTQVYTDQAANAIDDVVFLRDISSTDIRILMALASLNRCGIREIRGQSLCRLLNLSERTVYRSLSILEKRGYIRRVKRPYKPSVVTVRWEKLSLALQLGASPRAQCEQTQPDQQNSVHVRTKVPNILHTKTTYDDIKKKVERAIRSVIVPPTSYLHARASTVRRVAHALKLNYVKVIIAILLADYYKTVDPGYKILYPAAWIARMGTLPDEELRIPNGFPEFVQERLPFFTEKQMDLGFPPDGNPAWRQCPHCREWVLDRPLWGLEKHMRYSCRARDDIPPRACPVCETTLPQERDAAWFHMERCRLRQRLEEIAAGSPAREIVECPTCHRRVNADLVEYHRTHECQPETWSCPKCHRRLPPSREELEWHLSVHDLVERTGGGQ